MIQEDKEDRKEARKLDDFKMVNKDFIKLLNKRFGELPIDAFLMTLYNLGKRDNEDKGREGVIKWIRQYVAEYNKQVMEEEGHNKFDEYSEINKASVSALGLFLSSFEKEWEGVKHGKKQ